MTSKMTFVEAVKDFQRRNPDICRGLENPIIKFARELHEAEAQAPLSTESAFQCIVHKARSNPEVEVLYYDATSIFTRDREPQLETSTPGKVTHDHNR